MANNNIIRSTTPISVIPEGTFCSGNCAGCFYWEPRNEDSNGRTYCSWYDTYYYPSERNGCLSRRDD